MFAHMQYAPCAFDSPETHRSWKIEGLLLCPVRRVGDSVRRRPCIPDCVNTRSLRVQVGENTPIGNQESPERPGGLKSKDAAHKWFGLFRVQSMDQIRRSLCVL